MSDLTSALTQKIGPLPGFVYVVGAAGAIFFYRKKRPATTYGTGSSTGVIESPSGGSGGNIGTPAPPSNQDWALKAAGSLQNIGGYSGFDINSALSNFLSGASLSGSEKNIVSAAISANGFPSGGLVNSAPNPDSYNAGATEPATSYIAPDFPNSTPAPPNPNDYTPAPTPPVYVPPRVIDPAPAISSPGIYTPPPVYLDPPAHIDPQPFIPSTIIIPAATAFTPGTPNAAPVTQFTNRGN